MSSFTLYCADDAFIILLLIFSMLCSIATFSDTSLTPYAQQQQQLLSPKQKRQ